VLQATAVACNNPELLDILHSVVTFICLLQVGAICVQYSHNGIIV